MRSHTDSTKETNPTRLLIGGALGGAWGGALAGIGEATLITATAAPGEEYWLFPFAIIWYGALGCGLGIAASCGIGLVQRLRGRSLSAPFAVAVACAFACLTFVVARYHIVQRVFAEQLITVSAQGLAVHVGLLLAVAAFAMLAWWVGKSLQRLRHGHLTSAVALLATLGLASLGAAMAAPRVEPPARQASARAQTHPNIILIVVDTLRADAVGAYGAGPTATPHLDQLARDGIRFDNMFVQSTWTRPSIATILTSLYPSQHGAVHKLDPLPDDVTTLAEMLRAQGYWTAGFVSNINVAPIFNFQQGFAEYRYLAPSFYFGATDSAARLAAYKGLRVLRERLFGDRIYFYHYYQDAAVVNDAVARWLSEAPPSPFFLLVHYMDPHDPYFEIPYDGRGVARVSNPSPPSSMAPRLRQLYAEDVTYFDEHFGELLQRLRAAGLYDRSVIAVTADHGEEFQDHGGWWHGTTLYQEQLHVPLIIRRPREPRPGAVEVASVRSLDIVPTLLAAAALPVPAGLEGRDLFGAVSETGTTLFAEENLEGNVLASYRSGDWKLITANPGNPRGLQPSELYNLAADPREQRSVATEEPSRVQALRQQMDQLRRRLGRREG